MLVDFPENNSTPLDPTPELKHRKFIAMLKMCGSFILSLTFFGAMLFSGSWVYIVPMTISLLVVIWTLRVIEKLEDEISAVQETLDARAKKALPRDESE